jgi:hypothetical protein
MISMMLISSLLTLLYLPALIVLMQGWLFKTEEVRGWLLKTGEAK